MQREVHAPRRRHVGEVLVHERGRRRAHPLLGTRLQAHPADEIGVQMRRVPHWIAQGHGIQVDEDHAIAVQEHVIGLEIPMHRPRCCIGQAVADRGGERLDLGRHLGTGPRDQPRRPPHLCQLVGAGMLARDGDAVVLVERRHRAGDRAHDRGVAAREQQLEQWRTGRLLEHQRMQVREIGDRRDDGVRARGSRPRRQVPQQVPGRLAAPVTVHLEIRPHRGVATGRPLARPQGVAQRRAQLGTVAQRLDGALLGLPGAAPPVHPPAQALEQQRLDVVQDAGTAHHPAQLVDLAVVGEHLHQHVEVRHKADGLEREPLRRDVARRVGGRELAPHAFRFPRRGVQHAGHHLLPAAPRATVRQAQRVLEHAA